MNNKGWKNYSEPRHASQEMKIFLQWNLFPHQEILVQGHMISHPGIK